MSIRVDTRGMTAFIQAAAAQAKVSVPQMLRAQTGKILERCIDYTPASKKIIIPRTRGMPLSVAADGVTFSMNDGSRKKGVRGREWMILKPGVKLKNIVKLLMDGPGNIRPHSASTNNTWRMLRGIFEAEGKLAEFNRRVPVKNTGRGLSKRSWLEIADALGIPIKFAGYIRTAIPRAGRYSRKSTGAERKDGEVIEITNMLPTARLRKHGADILSRVIRVRMRAMEIEIAKNVFTDLKTRAQRYPGIFVKQ